MRLRQNQLWQIGETSFRIVQVDRLSVEYKKQETAPGSKGTHETVSKKEFCRLIKGAVEVK